MKMWASQEIVIYVVLDVWAIILSVKIMPFPICLFSENTWWVLREAHSTAFESASTEGR